MTEYIVLSLLVLLHLECIAAFLWLTGRLSGVGYQRGGVLVDTSSLMDGRILAVMERGFMPTNIIIPRSVMLELQMIADGADGEKRSKARSGLEVAREIGALSGYKVRVLNKTSKDGVDNHLLRLAKKYHASICTMDYNLIKVAEAEQIKTLNLNELAQELRLNHLPGEKISLTIVHKGNDGLQGVGYLVDGTMVVVERAKSLINSTVEVEVIRSIQTAAGKMLFAKPVQAKKNTKKSEGRHDALPRTNEDRLLSSIERQAL